MQKGHKLWTFPCEKSNNQLFSGETLEAVSFLKKRHLVEIYTIFWLSFKSQLFLSDSLKTRGAYLVMR